MFTKLFTILTGIALFGAHNAAAEQEQGAEVNVYSASQEHLIRPALEIFSKETGIKVNYTTIGGAALTARLELEGEDTPADVIINADVGNIYHLQEKGLLQSYISDTIKKNIPELLREPSGLWTGVAKRSRVVFYRKEDGKPEINSYADLADPKWKGDVLIRSSTNIYNQSLLADMIYRTGEENALNWAKSVVANMARAPEGGDRDQLRALASGVGKIAVANTYYYGQMIISEDPVDREMAEKIAFVMPQGMNAEDKRGPHVNIRGAAITKHAKHVDAAQMLVDFLTTEPAQRFFADSNQEFVANPEIAQSDIVAAWDVTPEPKVSLVEIGKLNAKATAVFDEANWP